LISSSIVASTGAAFAKSLADFKAAKHKGAEQIFGLFQLSKPDAVVECSRPMRLATLSKTNEFTLCAGIKEF
jgi:hypothetical protein